MEAFVCSDVIRKAVALQNEAASIESTPPQGHAYSAARLEKV